MVFRWWNCLAGGQNGIHDLQEVLVDHILVSKNEGHILKLLMKPGYQWSPGAHMKTVGKRIQIN